MIFDLHVHTTASPCSSLTVEQILDNAESLGLDGVCITDHGAASSAKEVEVLGRKNGLTIIVGMEYSTEHGDLLLFGPDLDIPPGMNAIDVVSRIKAQGGGVIVAHPFRLARPASEDLVRHGLVSAVEAINGRNTSAENNLTASWFEKYPLQTVGGSDAHSLEELGKVTTEFDRPVRCWQDLVEALDRGRVHAQ